MQTIKRNPLFTAAATAGSVAFASVTAATIHHLLPLANLSLIFLVPVLFAGVRYGPWPAFFAAFIGVTSYNFFFTVPRFTFNVYDYDDIATLAFFLLVAFVTGNMAVRLNHQIEALQAAVRRNQQLARNVEEAQVRAETEQLRAALLSSVSHDLRTPLSSIIGSVTTIQDIGDRLPPPARQELLGTVLAEAQRLNGFIQNLLDIARLGQGGLTPRREWAEFRDILGHALKRQEKDLATYHVVIDSAPADLTLYVDPVLMQQVLVNILDNATKYAPRNTSIYVTCRQRDTGDAFITVADEGPGIPAPDRPQVFDMFYRTRARDSKIAGTGLGLAICKGIVEVHGGTIRVDEGPEGHGATIVMTFPPVMIGRVFNDETVTEATHG